jgi:hypothetical protein
VLKIVRDHLVFTVGDGGDFTDVEVERLRKATRAQGVELPLPLPVVEAMLRVKRILGGTITIGH